MFERYFDRGSLLDGIAAAAFYVSLPLLMPVLDALHHVMKSMSSQMTLSSFGAVSLPQAMPIAVMFTALVILVGSLRGVRRRSMKRYVLAGAALYLLGYLGSQSVLWMPSLPGVLLTVSGLLLGVGASLLALAWLSYLRLYNICRTFELLLISLCFAAALNMALNQVPWQVGSGMRFALACIGALGTLRIIRRQSDSELLASGDSVALNWREAFGTFSGFTNESSDSSISSYACIRFFVVTPVVILLLFSVNRGIDGGATLFVGGLYTPETIAGLICVFGATIMLIARSDHNLISIICRQYLPMLALVLFAVIPFLPLSLRTLIMHIGINVFCLTYALLLSAMLLTAANRIRSLLTPIAALLLIGLSLVALFAFRGTEAAFLGSYRPQVCIALFTFAVALLLFTPGPQIWQSLIEGAAKESKEVLPFLQERCAVFAKTYRLTEREAEILPLLGRGYSASHVAEMLVVAESTVRSHRNNIYRKLSVNSREELFNLLDDLTIIRESR
ncbi:MAG: LuxR C-terminal-related transcriptional regulator [Coriobacteriales bacterium]|jgi:DNA-binding CsgD family transcriptional regulator|nr:LuxR C-terminal-related transcriptional regulator [Coriobacteriales bacterium]